MIESIADVGSLIVVVLFLSVVGWQVVKHYWPAAATTAAGQQIEKVTDKTQTWNALAALQVMRFADEIKNSPEGIAEWKALYKRFGGTVAPDTLVTNITLPRGEVWQVEKTIPEPTTNPTVEDKSQADWKPS